jgi:glycolate oxidase
MAARRIAIPAVERLGSLLIEDVGVPIPRIPELIESISAISDERSTRIAVIGHAGDGNFHPLIIFDPTDAAATGRAESAYGEVMEAALSLGGTITGEHGIGTLKRPWIASQLEPDVILLSHQIKQTLDPLNILNPGKAL